jgi:sulfide:quinone oxidoreductase
MLDYQQVPDAPNVHAFWDPAGAEAASNAARDFQAGTVAVIVSSLPYRCPPAPFGMAMELADYYRGKRRNVRVVLTTPEETPLAAIGGGVPEFLEGSCAAAGVELVTGFDPELAGLGEGRLTSAQSVAIDCDTAFVIPAHVRSPIFAGLPGQGPLVEVSPRFESVDSGLFVVGDAARVPLPRAAEAAASEGRTAADTVLEGLGLSVEQGLHLPEPECYVGHGGGDFSRISLRYPGGLPPRGRPEVKIEGPSKGFAAGFEGSFNRWRELRGG